MNFNKILKDLKKIGGGKGKKKSKESALSCYHSAILGLASQKKPITIAVVGANDGKIRDPVFSLVEQYIHDSVELILVEPQPYLIDMIHQNYAFVENKHIFNVAIADDHALKMYRVRQEFWEDAVSGKKRERPSYSAPTGVTSMQKEHVVRWAQKHVKVNIDIADVIEEFEVVGRRLGQLLAENNLPTTVDVLQVDAEGEDDTVLYACDLELTKPAIVYFESMNLGPTRLAALSGYLHRLHYQVFQLEKDTLAIRRSA